MGNPGQYHFKTDELFPIVSKSSVDFLALFAPSGLKASNPGNYRILSCMVRMLLAKT